MPPHSDTVSSDSASISPNSISLTPHATPNQMQRVSNTMLDVCVTTLKWANHILDSFLVNSNMHFPATSNAVTQHL